MDYIALTRSLDRLKVTLITSGFQKAASTLEDIRFDIIAGHWSRFSAPEAQERRTTPSKPGEPRERRESPEHENILKRLDHYLRQQNPISLWLEPPHLGAMIEKKGDEYHMNLFETRSTSLAHKKMDKEEVAKFLEPHRHWTPIQHVKE